MSSSISMAFDIFARDHASRTFDQVGDRADRLGDRLSGVGAAASSLTGRMSGLTGRVSGVGSSLTTAGAALTATALKTGVFAAAAASAASSISGLVAALAPAAGIVTALPGAVALGAAGMVSLKVALMGVGDAFAAALGDDAKKFEESLAGLSPAAQSAARELRALKPQFDQLKSVVQDALFAPLQGQITMVAAALQGPLQAGMSGVAAAMGQAAVEVAAFARSSAAVGTVNTVFDSLRATVRDLSPAIQPLLTGFARLTAVGASFTATLAPGIADAAARFGNLLTQAADSGRALSWMQGAVAVFRQLGAVAADVGGILAGVWRAMQVSGTGALGVLGRLLEALHAFVDSAQGQQTLGAIFRAVGAAATAVLPVIQAVAVGIGALAPTVAQLAVAVGPILTAAVQGLVPALAALGPGVTAIVKAVGSAVGAIAPTLATIGHIIAQALSTVAPLIGQIGPALAALAPGVSAVVGGIASAVAALAPALVPVGRAISGILVALTPLLPVLGQLAALIATSLASGVQAVLPSLRLLVDNFGRALLALAPVIPLMVDLAATMINSLVPALAPLLPQVATLITHLVQGLVPALTPLIPIIGRIAGEIGQQFVGVLGKLLEALLPVLPLLSDLGQRIGLAVLDFLVRARPLLPMLADAFIRILDALTPMLRPLTDIVVSLLPPMAEQMVAMTPLALELALSVLEIVTAIQPLLLILADLAVRLSPVAVQMMELTAKIVDKFLPAIRMIAAQVLQPIKDVVAAFQWLYDVLVGHSIIPDLIGAIGSWFGQLPGLLGQWVGQAAGAAVAKFNELVTWVSGLPGRIIGALGDVGRMLYDSGRSIMQGLINGLYSMLQDTYNAAADILGRIRTLFPFSPAKEGPFSGRGWTAYSGMSLAEGFADGMTRGAHMVRTAAERMTAMATIAPATPSLAPAQVPSLPVQPRQRTVQLAGQAPATTNRWGGLIIEHYHAAPNHSIDDIAERLYLLSIARGY